jgi:hypothetical protein
MVAAFTNGLKGNPGNQVRFVMPSVMDDAVRIAVTVEQGELCRGKTETFYANTNSGTDERKKHSRGSGRGRGFHQVNGGSRDTEIMTQMF